MDLNRNKDEDEEKDNKDRKVVLLLGWTGSKARHLRKYRRLYQKLGFVNVSRATPLTDLELNPGNGAPLATELLRKVQLNDPQHFVIHVFSNGGAFVFCAVRMAMEREPQFHDLKSKLCCLVMDSLPSRVPRVIWAPYLAFLMQEKDDSWYQSMKLMLWSVYFSGISLLKYPWEGDPMGWYSPLMRSLPTDVPELYLYSEGDKLVSYVEIQEFILFRKQNGAQCREYNFGKDSPHVNHFGIFPAMYETQLRTFLTSAGVDLSANKEESLGSLRLRSKL